MTQQAGFLHSLQFKLIIAFSSLTVIALLLAGGIFVALNQDEEKQRALDHAVAAAPGVQEGFLRQVLLGATTEELESYVHDAAKQFDVRILLVDKEDRVLADTGGGMAGETIDVPDPDDVWTSANPVMPRNRASRSSWQPAEGDPGSAFVFVGPFPLALQGRVVSVDMGPGEMGSAPFKVLVENRVILAVSEANIARAWLGLLPGLAMAALIALPVAILLAVVFSRYVTRPLERLTAAADRMSEGVFDVDVPLERRDEVGQLARAFSSMATKVGKAHVEMRMLVANVSHDMRTPLTSILGFAGALRTGMPQSEEESRHMGDVIQEEAERLAGRLNNLTYLSEIEAGQVVLQRDEIDLAALVDAVAKRTLSTAEANGISVDSQLAEGIIISVDGAKVERALENLLDNARKFTLSGGRILVRSFLERDTDVWACVEVANPAPDVEEEELPRLFDRFYRRSRNETGSSAGSGLGLPIARELVELHGGTLETTLRDGELSLKVRLPL